MTSWRIITTTEDGIIGQMLSFALLRQEARSTDRNSLGESAGEQSALSCRAAREASLELESGSHLAGTC